MWQQASFKLVGKGRQHWSDDLYQTNQVKVVIQLYSRGRVSSDFINCGRLDIRYVLDQDQWHHSLIMSYILVPKISSCRLRDTSDS